MTGNLNNKLHDISWYAKSNDNTPHDVIFDVIKPNDAGKMACLMNKVQHIFIDFLSVRMEIDQFCLHCCRIMHCLSFKCFVINHSGLLAFVIKLLHI